MEIAQDKAMLAREKRIVDLKKRLQSASAAPHAGGQPHAGAQPRVITKTVIRYIRVPTPVKTAQHPHSAQPASKAFTPAHPTMGSMDGWSLVGGNTHEAMLSGPGGQVQSVRVGDALANGAIVQKVGIGEVQTNEGIIR